jgi:hypothetical protein
MNIPNIVESTDRRLSDLDGELTQLQSARTALLNGSAEQPRAVKRRRSPRVAVTPSYDVVPVGKLTGLLAGSEGLRTRDLAHSTNGDPALIRSAQGAGVRRQRAAQRFPCRDPLASDHRRGPHRRPRSGA